MSPDRVPMTRPSSGRQAHRRLDRDAAADRRRRRAVAQVQHDLVEVLEPAAEHARDLAGHVLVRRPVEAVPAHPVLAGDLPVDRVRGGRLGQRAEERGVEHDDVRHVREQLAGHLDAGEVGRVVQRRQRGEGVDLRDDLVVDDDRRAEDRAAVHHPVADRDHVRRRRGPGRPRRTAPSTARRPAPWSATGSVRSVVLPRVRVLDGALVLADPLDDARRDRLAADGVDQLVLDRRRAGVDDEHGSRVGSGRWGS